MATERRNELEVLAAAIHSLAEAHEISDTKVLELLSRELSSYEELKATSWQDLDAIVLEGLAEEAE